MSFITSPTNIDYLIPDVRLRIGDIDGTLFSDTLVRTSLIGGIKYLQSRWANRYMVYSGNMFISPQPIGVPAGYISANTPVGVAYIPSGLADNDVFRNPVTTFTDTSSAVIVQTDEPPIIIAAIIVLSTARLSSSASAFVNWSDGEYSYSNVASSNVMRDLLNAAIKDLDAFFKRRLASPKRENLPDIWI